jgi:hypothetical protein
MTLVQWTPGDSHPSVRSVKVPGVVPLPAAEPALRFEPDGTVRASALFAESGQPRGLVLVDATWPPGAADGRVTAREHVATLAGPARAAAVTYSVARLSPGRREWLVLLADGSTVFSASPAEHHHLAAAPVLPLQMLAMSQATYVLAADKQGFPQLLPLH